MVLHSITLLATLACGQVSFQDPALNRARIKADTKKADIVFMTGS